MSKTHTIRKSDKSNKSTQENSMRDNITPEGVPGVEPSSTANFNGAQSQAKAGRTMEPLANDYIARAVLSHTRAPSLKLKSSSPQFYADLLVRRELTEQALKSAGGDAGLAFVNMVRASQIGGGSLDAARLVRDTARQLLWLFAVDVARDRRVPSERDDSNDVSDATFGAYPGGEEREPLPTEDEARIAYAEAHAWLSSVADLIPVDEDERIYLSLDKGLEYASLPTGGTNAEGKAEYENCYDFERALDWQLEKNEENFKQRAARHAKANADKFLALAALVGG